MNTYTTTNPANLLVSELLAAAITDLQNAAWNNAEPFADIDSPQWVAVWQGERDLFQIGPYTDVQDAKDVIDNLQLANDAMVPESGMGFYLVGADGGITAM